MIEKHKTNIHNFLLENGYYYNANIKLNEESIYIHSFCYSHERIKGYHSCLHKDNIISDEININNKMLHTLHYKHDITGEEIICNYLIINIGDNYFRVFHSVDEKPIIYCKNDKIYTKVYSVEGILHSLTDVALYDYYTNRNDYYINGINYSKTEWFIEKAKLLIGDEK